MYFVSHSIYPWLYSNKHSLVEQSKKVYINEVNSCPGSLAFYLWEPLNIDYTELLDKKRKEKGGFEKNIILKK